MVVVVAFKGSVTLCWKIAARGDGGEKCMVTLARAVVALCREIAARRSVHCEGLLVLRSAVDW